MPDTWPPDQIGHSSLVPVIRSLAHRWWQIAVVLTAIYATKLYRDSIEQQKVDANLARVESSRRETLKVEQEKKEYVARRRTARYEVYAKEAARFRNADSPEYNDDLDRCQVRFKNNGPPDPVCARLATGDLKDVKGTYWEDERVNCATNTFIKIY